MKRIATVLGVTVLIAALAVPALARGRGWGRTGSGWGDSGTCGRYDRGYGNTNRAPYGKANPSDQKFLDKTADLRNQIRSKSYELNTLLNSTEPDIEKARSLQGEISELRAQMDEKQLEYNIETRKNDPDASYGKGYGMGYGRGSGGMGYGQGMMGGGHMMGRGAMMDYGTRGSW